MCTHPRTRFYRSIHLKAEIFFFSPREKQLHIFLVPLSTRWFNPVLPLGIFSSVYIRVGETEERGEKQRRGMGGSSEDNDDNDDTIGTLLEHSLWENGGKAGWLVSNEFAGRVLSMYP